jgi:uncharacterized repeat protein (TIGR03987 family)
MTVSNIPMIIISLALVFYSIGVWSERISTQLKTWHLVFFWLGLICDTWGTGLMHRFNCHSINAITRGLGNHSTDQEKRGRYQQFP